MAQFKDKTGRTWTLELDAPTIERVRQTHGIDLLGVSEDRNPWSRLDSDLCLLVNVAWTICEPQARTTSPSVTAEEFGRSLVGQSIADAMQALVDAVTDFFPPERRSLLLCLWDRNQQLNRAVQKMALSKAEDRELEQRIMRAAEQAMDNAISERLTRLSLPTDSPE